MADEINSESPVAEAAVESSAVVDAPAGGSGKEVESSPDRSALEARVAEGLKTIRELDDGVEQTPEVEADEPKAVEGDEPAATEKESVKEDNPADVPEQQPQAKKPAGPTLPDAYRRSLKAYDWTDDEIDAALKANPLGFTVTAQKLHSNRNNETSRWAEMGRASRAAEPQQDAAPKVSPHIDPATGLFKPIDVSALGEKYGNPEFIAEIATPFNEMLAQINALLPDLTSGIKTVKASRAEQLAKQIDGFFGSPELQPFMEAYGKDTASLSEPQIETRNKVLELADALVTGAKQQGRKLSVNDALLMAHDHVGSDLKTRTIRKEIKTSVKQRNAGLTVRPTAAGKAGPSGPAKNKAEMESRTRARLAAVFGG